MLLAKNHWHTLVLSLVPFVVVLFGGGELGLCRFALRTGREERLPCSSTVSGSTVLPSIATVSVEAESHLSSMILLPCSSLRLWVFVTALENCRNTVAFHLVSCCLFPNACPLGEFRSCEPGGRSRGHQAVCAPRLWQLMGSRQSHLRLPQLLGALKQCECCKTLYILQLFWNLRRKDMLINSSDVGSTCGGPFVLYVFLHEKLTLGCGPEAHFFIAFKELSLNCSHLNAMILSSTLLVS